jgi:formylglycine-generating enzyme required for sulfatase activity
MPNHGGELMTFTLETWKEQSAQKINQISTWLKRRRDRDLPLVAYSAVSTLALWPVIEAAMQSAAQTGHIYGVLGPLYGVMAVAGNVGAGLLANQLEQWAKRPDDLTETEVAAWIADQTAVNSDLRQALDAVLSELQAIPQVQAALPDEDRAWFEAKLQKELSQLKSVVTFEATVIGDGAVVQGEGAVGAGAGGVAVKGNVHGDVLLPGASKTVVQPSDPEREKLLKLQHTYLERLANKCNVLPLAALGSDTEAEEEISLEAVYVDLDTKTRVPVSDQEKGQRRPGQPDERPLSALEAAIQAKKLVLVGDPGSGKSTFVRQLAGRLAFARLGKQDLPRGWLWQLWPMLTTLRDLAPRLAALELDGLSEDDTVGKLVDAVWAQWQADLANLRLKELAGQLDAVLAEEPLLIIFDGLDEVPEKVRGRVRQAVAAVLKTYPNIERVIVTCRVRSYTGAAVLKEFAKHELAPFDNEKITRFVNCWYGAQQDRLGETETKLKAADLRRAVLDPDLRELSENPMLLTTMAIIHQQEVGLPKERVRLYHLAVQVLLSKWQKGKGLAGSEQLQALLNDDIKLRPVLQRLAYEIHQRQALEGEAAELTRGDIITLLEEPKYLGDIGLVGEFLDYVDQRSGLLVGRGGAEAHQPQTYDFPHRTFQEYLAGCQLVTGRSATINREYNRRVGEGDTWYLAGQLGAEELFYNRQSPETLLDLAYSLCPVRNPEETQHWRAALWSGQMAVVLGKETIAADEESPDNGPLYLQRLIPRLVRIITGDTLPPLERAEAGRVLAQLGDPRPEVGAVDRQVPDRSPVLAIQFCYMPAGPFWMGSPDEDDLAYDDEKPLHQVDVPYGYWITRYPVTVAQYRAFVEAGGYRQEQHWPEAIAHDYWQDGRVKRLVWDDEKDQLVEEYANAPYDFGHPFNLANHPVVGVNWYETMAFCRWVTDLLQHNGALPKSWQAMLPSEAEWEKAARGGLEVPPEPVIAAGGALDFDVEQPGALVKNKQPRQRYPWGLQIGKTLLNYADTGIGTTSAAGCFSGGQSLYGCQDMCGNVWEWTRSLWGKEAGKPDFKYPYNPEDGREDLMAGADTARVLRGGAFGSNENGVRCGVRNWFVPDLRYWNLGFRVVLSPLPLDSEPSDL